MSAAAMALMPIAGSATAQMAPPPPPAASDTQVGSDQGSDQDIVVTAERREQRLIDVPQSVSVISAKTLQAAHADRLQDFFNRVPSASVNESQAGQARIILRGINTGGVGATVATYVDDTPYGSATALANGAVLTPDIDPGDLARVEILRGPQGTLYGANSLGGLLKYVTIAPDPTVVHGSAEGNAETVDHGATGWSGRAMVNLPIGDDAAIRMSGVYRRDPGYIDDPLRGRDVNGGKTYGGRASLLVRPIAGLTMRGTVALQDLDSRGSNTEDVDPLTLGPTIGRYRQSRLVDEPSRTRYRVYNATEQYDVGPLSLVAATSWGNLDQTLTSDATGVYGALLSDAFGTALGATLDQRVRQRRFTQELRLASTGRQQIEWTLGGFYTRERNTIGQVLDGIADPTGAKVPDAAGLALVTIGSRYREVAGFASGTVHIGPRFDLTAGGRYSHNRQDATQVTRGMIQEAATYRSSSSDGVFTYSVAPSFKPNDRTTIYARVARGYRPGGPNLVPPGAPTTVPRQFDADTTVSYEMGIKADLADRLLSAEITAFHTDWDRIQLVTSIDNFAVNINGSRARSRGMEATLSARPATGVTLGANAAYVDAQLTQDTSALVNGRRGDWLPYSPRFAANLSADYERGLSGAVKATTGVSWRYTGVRRSAFDVDFGQRRLPGFGQVDAHAGLVFDRYRLDFFVRNLTGSRGIVDLGAAGSARGGAIAAAVVRPRSIGLTLGAKY